ncbi:hypothetical protein GCM10010912_51980 [Paenibacillus albidus]|uniref:Phage tail collar domain-containing protein n=1 Tax=Paenibacillus albidus TaxID=2041023 RepID=A0A917FS17_9BACL|nr:tail fiber protein [Paenibacillus albidus]GGG00739.1 hypothetical protein GCM10010912_51980 [Paenibacillus albidus]
MDKNKKISRREFLAKAGAGAALMAMSGAGLNWLAGTKTAYASDIYQPIVGEISMFAGNFAPQGWAICDGSVLHISQNEVLFQLIGTTYGGDGQVTFQLPDLRGRAAMHVSPQTPLGSSGGVESVTLKSSEMPAHTHDVYGHASWGNKNSPEGAVWAKSSASNYMEGGTAGNMGRSEVKMAGEGLPHDNMMPYLPINFVIALEGMYPSVMNADSYLGEIRLVAFNMIPNGWYACNGAILSIQNNTALFSILGTMYGGNGSTTFALPDLQARVPVHYNSNYPLGYKGGERNHTLTVQELPAHNHSISATTTAVDTASPVDAGFGATPVSAYHHTPDVKMGDALLPSGSSQPHENMQPYLTLNYLICGAGIFPSRS